MCQKNLIYINTIHIIIAGKSEIGTLIVLSACHPLDLNEGVGVVDSKLQWGSVRKFDISTAETWRKLIILVPKFNQ